MSSLHHARWYAVLLGLLVVGHARPAMAEARYGETVLVQEDEVIDEDLYLFGGTIRVDGTVLGDLVVAGGNVEINGEVGGDVMSAAGETTVTGAVGGSLRIAGGRMTIESSVEEDVVAAGGRLYLAPSARVGRDVVAAGGEVEIHAPVARNVRAKCGQLVLASQIGGDVDAGVGTLAVQRQAEVDGTLVYESREVAEIAPGAEIGALSRTPVESGGPLAFLYRWVRAIIGLGALGLILAFVFPRFARAFPETLKNAPLRSMGWGALWLLLTPLGAALLFFIGGVLGGWWLGLIALGVLTVGVAVSFPAVAYAGGLQVLAKVGSISSRNRLLAFLAGIAAITLLIRIPILGALIAVAVALFGLGALILTGIELRRRSPISASP